MFLPTLSFATISRVQIATGTATLATSVSITMGSTPTDGNAMILACGIAATVGNEITSVLQTGATWQIAASTANPHAIVAGSETEVWFAPSISGASTGITVNLAGALSAACHAVEYSGLAGTNTLDVSSCTINSSFPFGTQEPQTGTTTVTTQANELWFASIDNDVQKCTGNVSNSFSYVAQENSGLAFQGTLEYFSSAIGQAQTTTDFAGGGDPHPINYDWAGCMVTFQGQNANTDDPNLLLMRGTD